MDPSLVQTPLQLSELEDIAQNEGRGVVKDSRKFAHFLQRVIATVKLGKEQVSELKKELTRLQLEQHKAGAPTTLNPLDAARYLSDEQKAALFDELAQNQLAALRRKQDEADITRKKALQFAGQVRYELVKIVEEPTLPPQIRAMVEQLLSNLNSAARQPASPPEPVVTIGDAAAVSEPVSAAALSTGSPFSAPPVPGQP